MWQLCKVCEHSVRMVKGALRKQHGNALDDILIEKEIGGMTVLASIARHHEFSLMKGKKGKQHSHDYVGESARTILADQISKLDPFNRTSREPVTFRQKVRGDPYKGLVKAEVERFVKRKSDGWATKMR